MNLSYYTPQNSVTENIQQHLTTTVLCIDIQIIYLFIDKQQSYGLLQVAAA